MGMRNKTAKSFLELTSSRDGFFCDLGGSSAFFAVKSLESLNRNFSQGMRQGEYPHGVSG